MWGRQTQGSTSIYESSKRTVQYFNKQKEKGEEERKKSHEWMVLLQITTLINYKEIRNYNSNLDGISLVMGAMIQLVDSER